MADARQRVSNISRYSILWKSAHRTHVRWSGKLIAGTILTGFGIFNLVEGIIDHQLIGIHHVNETAARSQWIYWDMGFLLWGAAMLIGGWFFLKTGEEQTPPESTSNRRSRRFGTKS